MSPMKPNHFTLTLTQAKITPQNNTVSYRMQGGGVRGGGVRYTGKIKIVLVCNFYFSLFSLQTPLSLIICYDIAPA
jgi:hypothetical protein